MNDLNSLIEKISTLNINATTNIDVQSIIEKYVLFTQIGKVLIALISAGTILIAFMLIYKAYMKSFKVAKLSEKIDITIEKMKNYDKYEIKNQLKEILEYMPRNKKKRKLDDDDY